MALALYGKFNSISVSKFNIPPEGCPSAPGQEISSIVAPFGIADIRRKVIGCVRSSSSRGAPPVGVGGRTVTVGIAVKATAG